MFFITLIIMYQNSIIGQQQASPLSDTDAFKKGKPSDRELHELGLRISVKWSILGIRLGISQSVLDWIDAEGRDKPFRMLLRWKTMTSSATPYHDLYNALCYHRVGLNNLAKEFCCKETL